MSNQNSSLIICKDTNKNKRWINQMVKDQKEKTVYIITEGSSFDDTVSELQGMFSKAIAPEVPENQLVLFHTKDATASDTASLLRVLKEKSGQNISVCFFIAGTEHYQSDEHHEELTSVLSALAYSNFYTTLITQTVPDFMDNLPFEYSRVVFVPYQIEEPERIANKLGIHQKEVREFAEHDSSENEVRAFIRNKTDEEFQPILFALE